MCHVSGQKFPYVIKCMPHSAYSPYTTFNTNINIKRRYLWNIFSFFLNKAVHKKYQKHFSQSFSTIGVQTEFGKRKFYGGGLMAEAFSLNMQRMGE